MVLQDRSEVFSSEIIAGAGESAPTLQDQLEIDEFFDQLRLFISKYQQAGPAKRKFLLLWENMLVQKKYRIVAAYCVTVVVALLVALSTKNLEPETIFGLGIVFGVTLLVLFILFVMSH